MLYTQLLRDKLQETLAGANSLAEAADRLAGEEDVFFSMRFLLQRPLLKAILNEKPTVLLIDEIDRADAEFEAFLLEVLSDFQVTVPELGTLAAKHRPLVLLTSNNTRELSEALKRRCLYLYIGYPGAGAGVGGCAAQGARTEPKLARQAVELVQRCATSTCANRPASARRWTGPRRWWHSTPGSWIRQRWKPRLSVLLKHEVDLQKVKRRLMVSDRGVDVGGDDLDASARWRN
jgi:MoxR-like ATPase